MSASPAEQLATKLVTTYGLDVAREVVTSMLEGMSVVELAAHEADWELFWARPEQLPPVSDWMTWSFIAGRGFGKSLAMSKFVNREVRAGRAMSVCLLAQDEDNAVKLMVEGPSGLIATAAPDFKPIWEASALQLVWANGARAYVRTPEVPGKIRGFDYHLAWCTELQSWPTSTREEAWMNVMIATRLGYSRIVTDSTPKKRHPMLRRLLVEAERDPKRNAMVRGTSYDNAFLGGAYLQKLETEIGGTQKGREELLGEFLDDSESALVQAPWIESARRKRPDTFTRRVIGVDPATTSRKGSDQTGIVVCGLGADDQAYVLADKSGKYKPHEWAELLLDLYEEEACDCIVVETNKGGELVTSNLRSHCRDRALQIVELGRDERPRRTAGVINVKEVYARGSKEDRAQPLATAYERGRVSHVAGASLTTLEDSLTTWEPGPSARSPDDIDALTHAVVELLGFVNSKPNPKVAFQGITEFARQLATKPAPISITQAFNAALRVPNNGGRI